MAVSTRHFVINPTMPPPMIRGAGSFLLFVATATTSAAALSAINGESMGSRCLSLSMPYQETSFTLVSDLASSTTIYAYAGIFRIGAQYITGSTLMTLTAISKPTVTFSGAPFQYAGGGNHYVRRGTIQSFATLPISPFNFKENLSNKLTGTTYSETQQHASTREFAENTGGLVVWKSTTEQPALNKYATYSQLFFKEEGENYNSSVLFRYIGIITHRTVTQIKITNNVPNITNIQIDFKYGGVFYRYAGEVSQGTATYNTTENTQGSLTVPSPETNSYLMVQSTNAGIGDYKVTSYYAEGTYRINKITSSGIGVANYTLTHDALLTNIQTITLDPIS